MKQILGSIGILSVFAALGPAVAADLRVPMRQPVATQQQASSNWSGGQVGGNGGGSVSNNAFVEPGSYLCSGGVLGVNCYETPFAFDDKKASFVGGGFIGYRWQFGNYVYGVEGDALWQKATTSATLSYLCPPGAGGACGPFGASRSDDFYGSITQGWEGSIRGRYGYLMTPSTLIYGTAGVSFMEVKGSFRYFGSQPTAPVNTAYASGDWSDVLVGGTVGAGVETQMSARIKVRGEYRFSHYGSYSKDIPLTSLCPGGCGTPVSSNAHLDINSVYNHKFLLGIGWDW
jgi:outer membrane immunogenic protein